MNPLNILSLIGGILADLLAEAEKAYGAISNSESTNQGHVAALATAKNAVDQAIASHPSNQAQETPKS